MKYLLLFFILIYGTVGQTAGDNNTRYKVDFRNIQYTMSYSVSHLTYQDSQYRYQFKVRKCNKRMINNFIAKLKRKKTSGAKKRITEKNTVAVTEDSNTLFVPLSSKYAKHLMTVPKIIINMSIRDKALCKN